MMDVLSSIFSPVVIAFAVIIIGYLLGKIKVRNISLDLSGVLIVAVFVGLILAKVETIGAITFETNQADFKFFSTLGTALFVSSIGISTGKSLNFRKAGEFKAMLIGFLMVGFSFFTMKVISLIDRDISVSKLLGALCGALTTTPGLSTACELNNIATEEIVVGYGSTYLFGVIATVLFVQLITRKAETVHHQNEATDRDEKRTSNLNVMILVACAIVLGTLFGNINIFGFSLGNSGGMLCAGITIGLLAKFLFDNKSMQPLVLTQFRNFGLVLFFVGNGVPAGMELHNGFDLKILFYGAILTIVPIVVGYLLNKLIIGGRESATVIAGGMKSTPAIGLLVDKNPQISLGKYSLAYFGALITIVVLIRMGI